MWGGQGCLFAMCSARQGARFHCLSLASLFILLSFLSATPALAVDWRILGGVTADKDEAPYLAALLQRNKALSIADTSYMAEAFIDTSNAGFDAPLSYCAYGLEVCEQAQGQVCLIARGTNTFAEKVANCAAGGGVGAIIYNYLPHAFSGQIGEQQALPVLAVSSWTGQQLIGLEGQQVSWGYSESVQRASFFCGGSYLGDNWLLTAAHCVADRETQDIQVALGSGDYRDGRPLYSVQHVHLHQGYDRFGLSLGGDIALMKLLDVPESVEGIALADFSLQRAAIASGQWASALGRGEQNIVSAGGSSGSGSMTYRAYTVQMQLIDRQSCRQAMPAEPIEDDMICAGGELGAGTCFGDSGGPLVWQRDGQAILLGVVSWGVGCGLAEHYDVFTSVASYTKPVHNVVEGAALSFEGLDVDPEQRAENQGHSEDEPASKSVGAASIYLLGSLLLALAWRLRLGNHRS
ncbi:MAG: trypsin-like serine protease [Granulosicoccaceae bacterium]